MHYKDKNLQIDIRCHTVFMNDQKIELSLKEFTVLKYLTEHTGWVFSHEEIYRNVWKEEPIDCANAVMCCISQLRKKLKVDSRNVLLKCIHFGICFFSISVRTRAEKCNKYDKKLPENVTSLRVIAPRLK